MSDLKRFTVGEFSLKRLVRSALLIPLFVYMGVQLVGYFFGDRLIFRPPEPSYRNSEEIIKLSVGNGEHISALHLENPDAKYTVLFIHGNAEDLGHTRPTLEYLRAIGFSVFAFDYRGYGTSSGTASESNSYADADAAYNYLVNSANVAPEEIIVYGRSLGGAVAIDLAARRKVGGLIAESSFVSTLRVVTGYRIFPFDKFRSLEKISMVRCPVIVIHGTADEVIPLWHGERLFNETVAPKMSYWVLGAGHNNLLDRAGPEHEAKLKAFVTLIDSASPK
jgi:abhydrolase domain-containing protein 17